MYPQVDCCIQSPRTDAADLPPDPVGIPQLPRGIDAIVVAPADTAGAPPPPLAYAATTNRRQCGCESPLGPSLPGENHSVGDGYGGQISTAHAAACKDCVVGFWKGWDGYLEASAMMVGVVEVAGRNLALGQKSRETSV